MNEHSHELRNSICAYAIVGLKSELARWTIVAETQNIAIKRKGQVLGIGNETVTLNVCMAISTTGLDIPDGRYLLYIDSKPPISYSADTMRLVSHFAKGISTHVELYQFCDTTKQWVKVAIE